MASSSTQPVATADKSILTPVMTLEGHEPWSDGKQHEFKQIPFISYFPDGKQMISGSHDKTIRRWDLRKGKEIEKNREAYENVEALEVSRDGRWIAIAGDEGITVSEVETGIVRTFHEGDSINFIDISTDSTLLAGASWSEVQVWNLDTGELVANLDMVYVDDPHNFSRKFPGALRFSEDSRNLAVLLYDPKVKCGHLEVWDVQTQKLDAQSSGCNLMGSHLPIFWTTRDKSIVAVLISPDDETTMISELDALTLKTVGEPFKHTAPIHGLALSSDCVLLASSYNDNTIKLWAFESRQLLASFDVETPLALLLSPDSRQLAYTTYDDANIHICNIPANILANIDSTNKSKFSDIFNSYATRLTVRRKPVIIPVRSPIPQPLPTSEPHAFPRFLRKLLPFSSRTDAVHAEPGNLLDFPATSPLPRSHISQTPAPPTTPSSTINTSPKLASRLH